MDSKELFGVGRTYITAWSVMAMATALMFAGKITVDMWSTMMYSGMALSGGNKLAERFGAKKGS